MNNERLLEKLKANLFELTYTMEDYTRKDLMDKLCIRVKEAINASNIILNMYHKRQLDERIVYYASDYPISCCMSLSINSLITQFNNNMNVTVLQKNNQIANQLPSESTYRLKINCQKNYYGFMFVTFSNDKKICSATLEEIRTIIEQLLIALYTKRQQDFLRKRNQIMFQLSTKLHSVHQTTEVLKRVCDTIQLVYPSLPYYFLLTQEYEIDSLPIKMIEYTGDAARLPSTTSFINNELQVEYDEEENMTNIYAPLSGKQGVYGVLEIKIQQIMEVVKEELNFITQFTNMVGRAIERTTLYQTSNQLVSDLQIINTASHDLNLNLDQSEITETVKNHIFESCHAEQIGVVFFSYDEYEEIEILTESTDYFSTESGVQFVNNMYKIMMENPKPILSGNFAADGIETPYNSLMVIPMRSADAVFGMIIVAHHAPYYFSFDKYKFIQSFVQHASLAYTNSILKEKLKQTAITDYLTKLYSRNHLDKIIGEHMNTVEKGAFVLFDVDDFKQINDTFGHYIGDKVLIQVAKIIQEEIKQGEIAARWGGEEFAIYLPNCSLSEATKKANAIRQKVVTKTEPQVSLSSGVSTWSGTKQDTVERLFIRTDEALYEAKKSGKNKVVQNSY